MKGSRFSEEQIVGVLKEAEAGVPMKDLCRRMGISTATFYHWKAKYGGLEASETRRLHQLEEENGRLKKIVAQQAFDLDRLKGFPEVIESVYPKAEVQTCIMHMIRASLSYTNWKQRKQVAADLRKIYQAATALEAQVQLDEFAQKWDAVYPVVSQTWRRHWERITPFFAYPAEIREVIYTTNSVESLNMSLRKIIQMRGSFPNEEAALKLLYLALKNASKRWTRPLNDWCAALNRFRILWPDRMPRGEHA